MATKSELEAELASLRVQNSALQSEISSLQTQKSSLEAEYAALTNPSTLTTMETNINTILGV